MMGGQTPTYNKWQGASPSYTSFSQMASQGQPSLMSAPQSIGQALQQPFTPQIQNQAAPQAFTLAQINQTAGLPVQGAPVPQIPQPAPVPSVPLKPSPLGFNQWNAQNAKQGVEFANHLVRGEYDKYLKGFQ